MGARVVFLVGFMAAGKTTVGRELAQRLGWKFVDLDDYIEEREGTVIREIFAERGESGFRALEQEALRDLTETMKSNAVVALGGGAFTQKMNRDLLRRFDSVFLEAHPDELWNRSRIDAGKRPLRSRDRDEFRRLYENRVASYREAAVTIVTTGKDPVSLCAEIERTLKLERSSTPGSTIEDTSLKNPTHFGIGDSQ
jgi:shikimate kinase